MYVVDIHYVNRNETSKTVEAAALDQALDVVRAELAWTIVAHRDSDRWPPPYDKLAARLTLRYEYDPGGRQRRIESEVLLGFAYNKTSRRWEINATGKGA
jgi:hypothetical protein